MERDTPLRLPHMAPHAAPQHTNTHATALSSARAASNSHNPGATAMATSAMPTGLGSRVTAWLQVCPVPVIVGIIAVSDIIGYATSLLSMAAAGAGIYQVVHACVAAFCAALLWFFTGALPSRKQMLGIMIMMLGLAVTVLPPHSAAAAHSTSGTHATGTTSTSSPAQMPASMAVGVMWGIVSTFAYAVNGVVVQLTQHRTDMPSSEDLLSYMGLTCSGLIGVWLLLFTRLHWVSWVLEPVAAAGGFTTTIAWALFALTAVTACHGLLWLYVVSHGGAVAAAMVNGLRAAGVFLLAAALFCEQQESQCLTLPRGSGVTLVVAAVAIFATAPASATPSTTKAHV